VFLNILANAEQAIEENGVIEIETRVEDNNLLVIISDNGHGIMDKDLQRITDPFYTTKEPGKGTGLGLSITRAILQNYNALLHFKSKPGSGTSVTIQFPINPKRL
jgi:signal transduction histidine kinase